jgi:hypothetical protein
MSNEMVAPGAFKVTWKTLRYGDYKRAKKMYGNLVPKEGKEDEYDEDAALDNVMEFTISLLTDWNFVDADTGEPLDLTPEVLVRLSLDQFIALFNLFSRKFGLKGISLGDDAATTPPDAEDETEVKKTNESA